MFVLNCKVDHSETLTFRPPKADRRRRREPVLEDVDEAYAPVLCAECDTVVAVYDADEVYHFFDTLVTDTS